MWLGFSRMETHDDFDLVPVDEISINDISVAEFRAKYLVPGVPCLFTDFSCSAGDAAAWSRSFFEQSLIGDQEIYYTKADALLDFGQSLPLRSFLKQLDEGTPIKHHAPAFPPYEFLLNSKVALMEQVDLRALQRLFPDASFAGQGPWDWTSWPLLPPYPPDVYVAGANSTAPGHYDPDMSHTLHWCVFGHKRATLFPHSFVSEAALWQLAWEDLRKPIDWTKAPECLKGLRGWTVDIKPGQMLFMPSRTWHWFSTEEVSFSYVLRCRSFSSVLGSLKFFWGLQSPAVTLPAYGAMWAKIPPDLRQKMIRFRFVPPALASPIFRASILILGLPVYLWLLVRFGMSYLLMNCTSSKKARFCSKTITADKRGGAD